MDRVDWQPGVGLDIVETFQFWQQAQRKAHEGMMSDFTATAHAFRLRGGDITETPGSGTVTVAVSQGWASFNGEIIDIPAGSIVRLVTEVCWLEPLEQFVDVTAPLNSEAVGQPVQVRRTLVLKKGSNLPAQGSYMALAAPTYLQLLTAKIGSRLMPVGGVIEWTRPVEGFFDPTGLGLAGTDAEGWAICNGNNGTVDKRGLTSVGAVNVPSSGAGSLPNGVVTNYNVGDVFGAETVTLTIDQMPAHKHTNDDTRPLFSAGTPPIQNGDGHVNNTATKDTSEVGGGQAHENRQPSTAVVYVQVVG